MTLAPADALEVTLSVQGFEWTATCRGRTRTNELRVPLGRPVRLQMESDTAVTFDFAAFALRRAIAPGQATRIWIEATKIGRYPVRLVGEGRTEEVGSITVLTTEEFERDS